MATNRYDDITVARFNPMSFEELAVVPAMKRRQHDNIIAQQELLRAGLAKVDPYDKHFNEAVRIKQELESKMDQTASELAKTGINNSMIGKTIALNREYQNEIAPTGRLGQINAEKQNILKLNEEYDKLGKEKGWGQDRIDYWKNKALKEYNDTNSNPIYDRNGRINKYTGAQDVANKIDYNKYLHDLATQAKMSTTEFSRGIAAIAEDEKSRYDVVNKSSRARKLGDNYKAVKAAYDTLRSDMKDPTSELYRSMAYEGRDPNKLLDTLSTQSGVYKQSMYSEASDMDIKPFGSGPKEAKTDKVGSAGVVDPDSIKTIGSKPEDYKDLDRVGQDQYSYSGSSSPLLMGTGNQSSKKGKKWTVNDIDNAAVKQRYRNTLAALKDKGQLPNDVDENDPSVVKVVKSRMESQGPITLQSMFLRPDVDPSAEMFLGKKLNGAKDGKGRNDIINEDARLGVRTVLDPHSGKKLDKMDFGVGEGKYNLQYVGFDSPYNWRGYKFENAKEQQTMAHKALLYKKVDGQWVNQGTVPVSRTHEEIIDPNFKVANRIMLTYRNASVVPNEFVNFSNDQNDKRFKDLKVKYKTKDDYGNELDEPHMEVKTPNGTPNEYTLDEFTYFVDHLLK